MLASTTGLVLTTVLFHSAYKSNYDKYHDASNLGEFDNYYDKANNNYKIRNAFLVISSAAAITTFILWQADRTKSNRIYARNIKNIPGQLKPKWALGVLADGSQYGLSLNLRF